MLYFRQGSRNVSCHIRLPPRSPSGNPLPSLAAYDLHTNEHKPLSQVPNNPAGNSVITRTSSERFHQKCLSQVPNVSTHLNHKPFSKSGVSTVSNYLPILHIRKVHA